MRCAFLLWRFMRSATVASRESRIHASSAWRMLPNSARSPRSSWIERRVAREHDAAQDVALPAQELRRRVDDEVGAELERMLEGRAQEGVVDGDERLRRVRARHARPRARCRVMRSVGLAGVSTKTSLRSGSAGRGARERVAIAGRHAHGREAERLEQLVHEVLRAAVERPRVQERRAARQEREAAGRDRGHARVEDGRAGRAALERHELILEDLGVRVREPRVDQVDVLVLGRPRSCRARSRTRARPPRGSRTRTSTCGRRAAAPRPPRGADRSRA